MQILYCSGIHIAEDLEPLTNLMKSSRSSGLLFQMKVLSIWNTLSTFILSGSKVRQMATDSSLTSLWTKQFSNNCRLLWISSKRPRIDNSSLNWSKRDFFLTRIMCNIRDCITSIFLLGYKTVERQSAGSKLWLWYGYDTICMTK